MKISEYEYWKLCQQNYFPPTTSQLVEYIRCDVGLFVCLSVSVPVNVLNSAGPLIILVKGKIALRSHFKGHIS